MRWVVVTLAKSKATSIQDLTGKIFGITKFGGGSHINTILKTKQQDWFHKNGIFCNQTIGYFYSMIIALMNKAIDCFLWVPLSIKSLLNGGISKIVSKAYPPWPSFMITARTDFLMQYRDRVKMVICALQKAAKIFHNDRKITLKVKNKIYTISDEDCRIWLDNGKYSTNGAISLFSMDQTIETLVKVGVIKNIMKPSELIN